MNLQPFAIERYFAKHEFSAPYLLSASDSESYSMRELLAHTTPAQLDQWENLALGYTESKGHPDLLAAVANLYADAVHTDHIIEVVPEEGIFIAMNTLLQSGDHVVVTAPAYQSLAEIARGIGCEVTPWYPDSTNGWYFDPDALADLLRPETRLIVVNFPHNPTGALPTHDEYARIIELARERGITVFSDEMYRFFEFDPADRLPSACEVYENAVTLCGLSKSFGLPGLRVGWLATRNTDFMARFQQFKDYTTICSSAPSEVLAIIALGAHDQLAARNIAIAQTNLDTLDAFLFRHSGRLNWHRPKAGTITLAEVKLDVDIQHFADDLVAKAGVMIVPATIFDYPGCYFRLGFGRRNLPDTLAQFEHYLEAHT